MPETLSTTRRLEVEAKSYPLARTFAISRGSKTHADVVEVRLSANGQTGRGEGVPYPRYGESVEAAVAAIEQVRGALEAGADRQALLDLMPQGSARAAVDAALWDLEARLTGVPVWQIAGLPEPKPLVTAETIVLDTPEAMAEAAARASSAVLKLKLGGPEDLDRVAAVHAAAPAARLILDANEALDPDRFDEITRKAVALGVVLIEQPFPVGEDQALRRRAAPVAICADESVHGPRDLDAISHAYDAINIKLDKAGGLTAALDLFDVAKRSGLYTLVGCMVGSSLAMAPAFLLAGAANGADLDGAIWLAEDHADGLRYDTGLLFPPSPRFWGG